MSISVIATTMPKNQVAKKLKGIELKIVIHTARIFLKIALIGPVLFFFLINFAQTATFEQSEQVTLMQLEEVSDLIMSRVVIINTPSPFALLLRLNRCGNWSRTR